MSKNEAETRYELIDPVLRDKGYRVPYIRLETPAPVEPIGPKGRRRKGPGKTDYLLCVEVPNRPKPLPIAILEAKKESDDSLKGMQQAKGYSDCERFDAKYVSLKEKLKALRKTDARADEIDVLETKIKEQEKAARDSQSNADAIGATVFDLKAVNPNVVVELDTRTPVEVIQSIEDQGKIVSMSLETLRALLQA